MYFIDADALRESLRAGTVGEADVAIYAFLSAGTVLPVFYALPEFSSESAYSAGIGFIEFVVGIAITAFGVRTCFRTNGGANGSDFAVRYLSLAWVLSFRIWIVFFPILLALSFGAVAIADVLSIETFERLRYVVGPAFALFYYWRLNLHFAGLQQHAA